MAELKNVRKTKIVCTVGPATSSPEMLKKLILAGMNVARLNFSHGTHAEHGRVIKEIRRISAELERPVGILMDLAGPKIRLGELNEPEKVLEPGQDISLQYGETASDGFLPVNYQYLLDDVNEGDRILLADGRVELLVVGKTAKSLNCRVIVGGTITSRKGVNLPSTTLRIETFTEKDKKDLEYGLQQKVDIVALSFVRHEQDFDPIKKMFSGIKLPPLLVAKVERPEALVRLNKILSVVEGVMVARGDLGVEMPLEEVPLIQKRVIHESRRAGKAVITATQMLGSMVSSPRPSRAEVTDVANAIFDGTDAVMLSDETAVGSYAIEATKVLDNVCRVTEPHLIQDKYLEEEFSDLLPTTAAAISHSAVWLARDLKCAAIVAATTSGSTARLISRYRPFAPIIGLTHEPETLHQLCLSWGVIPDMMPRCDNADEMFDLAKAWGIKHGLSGPGKCLVLAAGLPVGVSGSTNLLRVIEFDEDD